MREIFGCARHVKRGNDYGRAVIMTYKQMFHDDPELRKTITKSNPRKKYETYYIHIVDYGKLAIMAGSIFLGTGRMTYTRKSDADKKYQNSLYYLKE